MKGKIAGRLEMCGLPADALRDCARATLLGRSCVMIEGQGGVIELSDKRIRLKTGEGVLSVAGEKLTLHVLSLEQAKITGSRIDGLSYLS